jgi:Tol biopolymer transport system component
MAAGDTIPTEFTSVEDPDTGVEVLRLTDDQGDTIFPYFTQPVFADDGERLLLSSNRTGDWQAYLLNLSSTQLVQLTDEEGGISHHASAMLPTQSACAVIAGRQVKRVPLDGGSGALALWGEREWISHVSVSPTDGDIVVFCHEGPWHLVQRLWVVRASTHEVWPLLPQRRYLDRSGHEYFTTTGRLVTQWSTRETPSSGQVTSYNAVVDPSGENLEMFRYDGPHPSHIQTSPDETLLVGDTCIMPELTDGRSFMCLVRHEGEKAIKQPLCRHDTSWKTQHSHPHPVFTLSGEYVVFNSDRGGKSNVYRAPAQWRG